MLSNAFPWERYRDQNVFLRVDANVPLKDGRILHDARLQAILPTLAALINVEARVLLVTHLGRPKGVNPALSTQVIADYLQEKLPVKTQIQFLSDWPKAPCPYQQGVVYVGENVRFFEGESLGDEMLSQMMVQGATTMIMEAFAVSHRIHASTQGAMRLFKDVCLGPLFQRELREITRILKHGKHPTVAVVGGAKVATKASLLQSLLSNVDVLIVGGGLAHAFWKCQGYQIGSSLCDDASIPLAQELMNQAKDLGKTLVIPVDVVVAPDIDGPASVVDVDQIPEDQAVFDNGPKTRMMIRDWVRKAATVIWNGPLGVCEKDSFSEGTQAFVDALKEFPESYVLAGGGETQAVIDQFNARERVQYASTAGGAFLYVLEHGEIPWLREIKGVDM